MPRPLRIPSIGKQSNALLNNARAQTSSFDAVKSSIGFKTAKPSSYLSSSPSSALVFPIDLRGQPNVNTIEFTAFEKDGGGVTQHKIFFPCPANIAINDSATYNTVELGTVGGAALGQGGGFGGILGGIAGGIANTLLGRAGAAKQNFSLGEIAGAMASNVPIGGDIAKVKGRTLQNPNTNTVFSGNALRSFTFTFKMVASSADEAELIRKIHSKFRKFTYASAGGDQNLLLAFPPTWTIRFLNGRGEENPYIPKIYSCYLVSIETSLNSTTNMFHSGGEPLEVDISVSYQETRVLNRFDIDNLETESLGAERGIDENGAPSVRSGLNTNTKPNEIEGGND
jgi:hypothetical protein